MNAYSYFEQGCPTNPKQKAEWVSSMIADILDGSREMIDIILALKTAQGAIELVLGDEKVKKAMFDELDKWGKDGAIYGGAVIKIGERRNFKYDNCNDSKLSEFAANAEKVAKDLKDRQKFLQLLKEPIADPETGEIIYPAAVTFTKFITLSEKKDKEETK